ncbi:MAG: DnaB-like helicase N-terminal domain-containing protein, partial [Propionibacteriaceae bacterium]
MIPPHNIDAEQSVLGAMMITPSLIPSVAERICRDDFYRDSHRLIFEAIMEIHGRGDSVDSLILINHLQKTGKLEEAGGRNNILTLQHLCPVAANAPQYAEVIKAASLNRRAAILGHKLHNGEILPGPAADQLKALAEASQPNNKKVGIRLSEVQGECVTWLWPGRIPFAKMTVLDGDPGLGKSTLSFDIAARLSRGHTMPDGTGSATPAGVVILSAEDGLSD